MRAAAAFAGLLAAMTLVACVAASRSQALERVALLDAAWAAARSSRDAAVRARAVGDAQRVGECFEFLVRHMPARDLGMNVSMLADTVAYALEARDTFPFAAAVPWHIFLNDVLPYSVLAEPRNPWRPLFFRYFATSNKTAALRADNMTLAAVGFWMNTYGWRMTTPWIHYVESQTDTINGYSPFQVLAAHNASCTGLSEFMVACFRSIGVPARIAGTPHWNLGNVTCPRGDASPDCGNHDWVEVWAGGGWGFVDQMDSRYPLNTSWFFPGHAKSQVPGTLNHSIFATSWAPAAMVQADWGGDDDPLARPVDYFPMVWDWHDRVTSAWDVTRRYLATPNRTVPNTTAAHRAPRPRPRRQ